MARESGKEVLFVEVSADNKNAWKAKAQNSGMSITEWVTVSLNAAPTLPPTTRIKTMIVHVIKK